MSADQSDTNQLSDITSGNPGGRLTDTQALFVNRLRHLLERRYSPAAEKLTESESRTLDRAIYSTLCDCQELKIGDQAAELLRQLRGS